MRARGRSERWLPAIVASSVLLVGVAFAADRPLAGITVTGTGVVWAEPDQAVVEVGWTGVEALAGEAVARATGAIEAIRDALERLGVAAHDTRTTSYFVWREERWDERGEPHLLGYRVSHNLQVTVRDVERVGEVITAATAAGANQVGGITFTVADRHALEAEARAMAVAAARDRAEQLADLSGLTLGGALGIEEVGRGGAVDVEVARDMGGFGGGAPVAAGRHAVEVVVRITFDARP
jgi:uncharacterized protein